MMRVKVTQTRINTNVDSAIQKRIDKVIEETAREIASLAAQLAPKDTGYLASSIHAELMNGYWRVVVGADYGVYPEYGTQYQAAQPYLRPAVYAVRSRIKRRLGQLQAGLGQDLGVSTRIQR